ncbi:MAG: hypothetical protein V4563_16960 [Pseudomonadota bacterium]
MAYLSNTDDEEQQKQSQGPGNFSAFGGGTPADSGGDQSGIAKGFSSWMGTSGGAASAKAPDSSDQSQQNAKGYQQTYAGDGNQDAKQQAKPDAPPMQQGLSGSGQGTGFINFQNYESQAPSQAGAISEAGSRIIGGEAGNLSTAEGNSGLTDTGGKTPMPGKGGTAGMVSPDPFSGKSPEDTSAMVDGLLNGGDTGYATLAAGLNPTQKSITLNYSQGDDYTKAAPELTETPITGGQTAPSVLDYLAKSQIASGGYTQGDRMLDSALISGDSAAQSAIQGNRALDKTYQDRLVNEVPGLIQKNTDYNNASNAAVGNVEAGIASASDKLQADIQAATAAANANPTPQTIANENAAVKAYQDWYAGSGQTGGMWSGTGSGQGQTAQAPVTPAQAQEANTIAKLRGQPPPYPDPSNPGGQMPGSSTYGGSGTAGAPTVSSITQTDPGDQGEGGRQPQPTSMKYMEAAGVSKGDMMSPDGGKTQNNGLDQHFTGPEAAVFVATHPQFAALYPAMTQADYAAAAYQLKQVLALGAGKMPAEGYADMQKALAAITSKLQAGGGATPQSPYAYGKSIGMSDAQLAAMGIGAPGGRADIGGHDK